MEIIPAVLSTELWLGLWTRMFNLHPGTASLHKLLLLDFVPVKALARIVPGITWMLWGYWPAQYLFR